MSAPQATASSVTRSSPVSSAIRPPSELPLSLPPDSLLATVRNDWQTCKNCRQESGILTICSRHFPALHLTFTPITE
jgi:hypothetical protein